MTGRTLSVAICGRTGGRANLELAPGMSVGIIGSDGTGKSTAAGLLARQLESAGMRAIVMHKYRWFEALFAVPRLIRDQRRRKEAVLIFDRTIFDNLAVFAQRAPQGGLSAAALKISLRLFRAFYPRFDAELYLVASEDVIAERRPELKRDTIKRALIVYEVIDRTLGLVGLDTIVVEPITSASVSSIDRLQTLFRDAGALPVLGDCSALEIKGPIFETGHTELFIGTLPSRANKILIKCNYVPDTRVPDVGAARRQIEGLSRVAGSELLSGRWRVAEPYHAFIDEGVMVQSWVEGVSFAAMLGQADQSRVAAAAQQIGEWLARFHRIGGPTREAISLRHLAGEVSAAAPGAGAYRRVFESAAAAMTAAAQQLDGRMQMVSQLHGDCKPSNIIVDSDCVTGIDVEITKRTSVLFDIAHFLNAMSLDRLASSNPRVALFGSAHVREAFLEGYGREGEGVDRAMLAFYATYDLARSIVQRLQAVEKPSAVAVLKQLTLKLVLRRRVSALRRLTSGSTGANLRESRSSAPKSA